MNTKKAVLEYLKTQPLARERKNKDQAIVNLLMRRYPAIRRCMESDLLNKNTLIEIVQDYANMDRYWRMLLDQNPELRGTDYDDKEKLEQKKELELGYRPGHTQDVKNLRTLDNE